MNVSELREKIFNLIGLSLGKYSNNLPSIWVYGGASNPPSRSDGLECLIMEMPLRKSSCVSGGLHYKPQEWQIVLKNYILSSNLIQAYHILENNFTVRDFFYMPSSNDMLEQCNFSIFDPITY